MGIVVNNMNKRYQSFNYLDTWIGIIRFAIGIGAAYGAYYLFVTDEPLPLRIFGSLLMLVCTVVCFYQGTSNIKDGIRKAKNHNQDILYGRDKPDLSYLKKDDNNGN